MKPMFLMSPALVGEFFTISTTWEAHIFPLDSPYIYLPKDACHGQKVIIFISSQFATLWSLKNSLFCHFSTNISFFVQKLCELHIRVTPLSYLRLNSLVCMHVLCIHKNVCLFFFCLIFFSQSNLHGPNQRTQAYEEKKSFFSPCNMYPLLKDTVLWHTWSSFDMMVRLSRTYLGL